MANEEHVSLLKSGVEEWNVWRAANPNVRPDLNSSDLNGAYLRGAQLHGARLRRALLIGADLRRADLREADLVHANLTAANLSRGRLDGAVLSGAVLIDTHFTGAHLGGVDVTRAILFNTSFGRVDLRGMNGLEQVTHMGPSTIGIDTLHASEGDITDVFLRGCGVPEDMIEFARGLRDAIQIYSCFISYAVRDEAFARGLYNDLQGEGVRCWLAQEDLKPGDKTWTVIEDQIRLRDKLLLILSEASIESEAVQREVEHALAQEEKTGRQILFPIYIDAVALTSRKRWVAALRKDRHFGKFLDWADTTIYAARLAEVIGWLTPVG